MSFRKTVIVLAALLVAAVLMAALAPRPAPGAAESTARVERGRYLVASIGCADCHAPKTVGADGPEPDMTRFLSGHPEGAALPAPPQLPAGPWIAVASGDLTAWSGPWGVSYAINLTPDENTGIGSWSEETFVKAIKTGRHMGVAADSAAHAVDRLPQPDGRRPARDIRLPADDPARAQPRARAGGTARGRDRRGEMN